MKTCTWPRNGGYTFVILFSNGTSGAEYVGKTFKTKRGAESAADRYREIKGDNWERGNMDYNVFNPETGEAKAMFRRRNFQVVQ